VRDHAPAVYRVVLGFVDAREADDLAQDVFVHVVQGLPSFDAKSCLGTWIHRIATNVGLNHLRTRRRKPAPANLADEAAVPARAPGPEVALHAREEEAALRSAVESLPDEFRAVVVLRVQRGLSFEEIARVLGIPRPTAESRMARAKEKLRALLGPWLEVDAEPGRAGRR
jgi:RNA polymerase sigma-70 factor (ECF subfamily)